VPAAQPDGKRIVSKCDIFKVIRTLMHRLASATPIPKKWAFSAVAGQMTKLIERNKC
jgi:hypothetical protein